MLDNKTAIVKFVDIETETQWFTDMRISVLEVSEFVEYNGEIFEIISVGCNGMDYKSYDMICYVSHNCSSDDMIDTLRGEYEND